MNASMCLLLNDSCLLYPWYHPAFQVGFWQKHVPVSPCHGSCRRSQSLLEAPSHLTCTLAPQHPPCPQEHREPSCVTSS